MSHAGHSQTVIADQNESFKKKLNISLDFMTSKFDDPCLMICYLI